jgi:modulator of FtsH protease HflC
MNRGRIGIVAAAAVAAVVLLLLGSLFRVHQTQQALVLQFGNPVRVVDQPGLNFKVPFIQSVEFFEKRVLDFDAPSVELVLGDQKRLVVDAFARYRIVDPLRFRQSVGSEAAFRGRLEPIVFSSLRSVLGGVSLFQVLSPDRVQLLNRLRDEANNAFSRFGVQLVDVRIKRADLPPENSQAIFRRMQTEREREAKELRAQGAEIGQRIRARADRERRVIIAEAQREAEITRGQGDADSIRVFAEAFGQDVDFFDFYRSMQAYRSALGDGGATSLVLSPQSEFFRYFNELRLPSAGGGGARSGPDLAARPPQPGTDGAAAAVTPPPAEVVAPAAAAPPTTPR